ncbi:MAG: hydroxymethylglutaryl-CoA synthase [Candidatus Peribacteraceae bacterium]|nr:hydroxymethylglutaryl-CoA synthase [Candidatus Peribacteraceae bacterium]
MPSPCILSFGRYVPGNRIESKVIAEHWKRGSEQAEGLGIIEKSVPSKDEDTFTLAWEAGRQALETGDIDPEAITAIFVGSESHPYAVKPTSGMLATALKLNPFCHAADLEFACKAGTAALQIVKSMVESKQIKAGMAIGSDTAQSKPGDPLEYSAAAGAAAFIVGMPSKKQSGICSIDATLSFTTDTPDFWRNAGEEHPRHAGRFTGEPAYFHHVITTAKKIMEREKLNPEDFAHVVLHMPNGKFPTAAAKRLGFTPEQLKLGFIVPHIGNTYSACSPLGLTFVLEHAKKGEKILLVSYGSGAGSDAFVFTMLQDGSPLPKREGEGEIRRLSYGEYQQVAGKS